VLCDEALRRALIRHETARELKLLSSRGGEELVGIRGGATTEGERGITTSGGGDFSPLSTASSLLSSSTIDAADDDPERGGRGERDGAGGGRGGGRCLSDEQDHGRAKAEEAIAEVISEVDQREKCALSALFEGTGGGGSCSWSRKNGWMLDQPPENWFGIETSIVKLKTLPPAAAAAAAAAAATGGNVGSRTGGTTKAAREMTTAVPVSSVSVSVVTGLHLGSNGLKGSLEACCRLSLLHNLIEVDLSKNGLTGRVPYDLAACGDSLKVLILSDNSMSGPLPVELAKGCTNLRHLAMAWNQLTGNDERCRLGGGGK
jgi:hypothetical protein